MGKTRESVFWHEIGHLIADLNNQNKLGIENFENYIELKRNSQDNGRAVETSWGGRTQPLIIIFSDSNDINEKAKKCAMKIACLAYGPILESVYLRQKGYAREDIIKDCWDLPNVDHAENYKKDKSAVRKILTDLEKEDPIIKAAWQANYSNQSDIFHGKRSVIDTVNDAIEEVIYSEAHRLNDLKSLTHKIRNINVNQYLNEINENLFEGDISLIKREIFHQIKDILDYNNFVIKIQDVIFNDHWHLKY
ncbi:hypothetical protein MCERE19_04260 [Spirosomataceae bacterium]|jgi:hypothetical protein